MSSNKKGLFSRLFGERKQQKKEIPFSFCAGGSVTEGRDDYKDNLCDAGNILLCGDRGSGKLPFIATMLCGLIEKSNPARLRVTILDVNKAIKHYMNLSTSVPHIREIINDAAMAANCLQRYVTNANTALKGELHFIVIYDENTFCRSETFMSVLKNLLGSNLSSVRVLYASGEIPVELVPLFDTKIAARLSFPHYCEEMGIRNAEHLHAPDELLYLEPGEKEQSRRRIVRLHHHDMTRILTGGTHEK